MKKVNYFVICSRCVVKIISSGLTFYLYSYVNFKYLKIELKRVTMMNFFVLLYNGLEESFFKCCVVLIVSQYVPKSPGETDVDFDFFQVC